MRAIVYIRVSTTGQAEEGVSLDAQEAKARAWATAHDAESVHVYRDEGISGGRTDRPGLAAALAEARDGDALVVYSLSRLSRSTKHLLAVADELRERGVDLVSMSESIDTTSAMGAFTFTLFAALGELEREQARERTRAALAYKRTRHEKCGGDVPFGYTARAGKLYPKAAEQEAVALMKRRRARGESLREIAAVLERQGIRRKGGAAAWHPEAVRRVLERESEALAS